MKLPTKLMCQKDIQSNKVISKPVAYSACRL